MNGYTPLLSKRGYSSPFGQELDSLFSDAFFSLPGALARRAVSPQHHPAGRVQRLDDKTVYYFALPGVSVDELTVEVTEENHLVYSVERRREHGNNADSDGNRDNESSDSHHEYRFVESVRQSISLDKDDDIDNIETDLSDGVLTIVVPKRERRSASRKLKVSTGGGNGGSHHLLAGVSDDTEDSGNRESGASSGQENRVSEDESDESGIRA